MTEEHLQQLQRNIENAKKRKSNRDRDTGTAPIVEPDSRDGTLVAKEVQRPSGARILVRVTSIRRRLLDEDNLCAKYHVDLCRYAGILPDDSPEQVKIEIGQRKAAKNEPERVVIEIYNP